MPIPLFNSGMSIPTPTAVDAYIGARLAIRRTMLRMSRETLALRLTLPVSVIAGFEAGLLRIQAKTLQDISQILQVPVRFFVDGYQPLAANDLRSKSGRNGIDEV